MSDAKPPGASAPATEDEETIEQRDRLRSAMIRPVLEFLLREFAQTLAGRDPGFLVPMWLELAAGHVAVTAVGDPAGLDGYVEAACEELTGRTRAAFAVINASKPSSIH